MSTQRNRVAKIVEFRPREPRPQPVRGGRAREIFLLLLLIVAACALRIDFIRAGSFVIDGDEAIVGLMANHILEGRGVPVFYYGQHYMGSLEPICAAVLFYLFGSSPFVLQLTPLLFSLALVVVMYALGKEVGGVIVARVAAALCAFPPVALVVWSYKARGGFIELLVLGALATLYFLRWLKSEPTKMRCAALSAILLGVGWWVNNQIVYFIVPLGLCGVLHLTRELRTRRSSLTGVVKLIGLSGACFLIGSSPYWLYNLRNGFPSLGMFGFAPVEKIAEYFGGLGDTALPILLGAKRFWEGAGDVSGATIFVYVVYVVVLGGVLVARRREIARLMRGDVDRDSQVEVFFLLMIFTCVVFASSTFGWLSQAPRYLLPLYIPLFVICGVWVKTLIGCSRVLGCGALAVLLALNVASCFWGGRAIPGEPVVFRSDRVDRDHTALIQELDALGITKVRTNYWIGYRLAFETSERITFLVLQEPRQVRIPEYQALPAGFTQDLVPLLLVPSERSLFVGALNRLAYSFNEKSVGGYVLLYDIQRPSMELIPLELEAIGEAQGSGTLPASSALDGSLATRWATGAPQKPGQVFQVSFKVPTRIAAIRIALGPWSQDYPRGLRIVGEDPAGNRETLLNEGDYPKLAAFFRGEDLEVWFPPRSLAKVIFEQVGEHGILDWSIAEMSFSAGSVDLSTGNIGRGSR